MSETLLEEEASDAVPRAARVSLRPKAEQPTSERTVSESERIVRPYIDVAEIRKAYPNPCAWHDAGLGETERYCVNGAMARFIFGDSADGFGSFDAIRAMKVANPNLSKKMMHEAYLSIGVRNDVNDMEGAWRILKKVLEYGIVKE